METSTAIYIAALSSIIAALSALITVWNYRREQLNQKIAAAKWKKEYFADLLKWSDEAMLILSEAMHLCELDPQRTGETKFFDSRHYLRVRLSAHIDRGRWFFPNYRAEGVGEHKQEAFRGYRHEVLDGLVAAYRELCALDYKDHSKNRARRPGIEQAKRAFTTEIQKVLDPRSRDDEFRKLLGSVAKT
ncbi:MAG: hypothetical protein J0L85_02430 [Zoogloea sp.]|nr:hypothetical protein [Zoogloea sp.]MCA0189117.1 hypothetical protein [Pseudomonadota bacterium]